MLAPIILFAYNRPWHVEQTIKALSLNTVAKDSVLFVYCDGPKNGASKEQLERIDDARRVVRELAVVPTFKEVHIIESEKNKGLANSIISGVTEIINRYGRAIVVEDDLVTSEGFLTYMNEALDMYDGVKDVAGVSGFHFIESRNDIYFTSVMSCLGWGTWKSVWNDVNFETEYWLSLLGTDKNLIKKYNIDGYYDYYAMLKKQAEGKTNSWAIRFYSYCFFNKKLFLIPKKPMLFHIGYDEGTNCGGAKRSDLTETESLLKKANVKIIPVLEGREERKLIKDYLSKGHKSKLNKLIMKIKHVIYGKH